MLVLKFVFFLVVASAVLAKSGTEETLVTTTSTSDPIIVDVPAGRYPLGIRAVTSADWKQRVTVKGGSVFQQWTGNGQGYGQIGWLSYNRTEATSFSVLIEFSPDGGFTWQPSDTRFTEFSVDTAQNIIIFSDDSSGRHGSVVGNSIVYFTWMDYDGN